MGFPSRKSVLRRDTLTIHKTMEKFFKLVLPVVIACTLIGGCGDSSDSGTPVKKMTDADYDDQIEKIKNDPSMNEQAKQGAIGGIEMARNMNKQGGQGAGKPGK